MRYQIDHDLHIHSLISPCAGNDPRQTKEAILTYGLVNGFRLLCVTDHIWDRKVKTSGQSWLDLGNDIEKGRTLLPLPQSEACRFLFGMEVDIDAAGNPGVSRGEMDNFDFLIFAPSHQHMKGFTVPTDLDESAEVHKNLFLKRNHALLDHDLPAGKTGLAHFTCSLACTQDKIRMFDLITDEEYARLFDRVRQKDMGVELNIDDGYTGEEMPHILRPYLIARRAGCKFYLGGDAHTPEENARSKARFARFIDLLNLEESDKYAFISKHRA